MSGDFAVISNQDAVLFERLKTFYKEVSELTLHHDVLNDSAVVFPSKLGSSLEKVDPNWYTKVL